MQDPHAHKILMQYRSVYEAGSMHPAGAEREQEVHELMKTWCAAVKNPAGHANVHQWTLHCVLHAKLRIVGSHSLPMIKVCPSFGDVLEQHTMLKNICPKLVAGEAPNTTGKMASYYI